MASITSRRRVDSTTTPGVIFTINKLNEGRRRTLRLSLAETNRKLRKFIGQRIKLEEEIGELQKAKEPIPFELLEQRDFIIEELDTLQMVEVNPAWMKFGLAAIEGLEIDGETITPETIDKAESPLYYEILTEIQRELGLTDEQQKNSPSPTTSITSEDGTAMPMTATPASDATETAPVTAESIPPQ